MGAPGNLYVADYGTPVIREVGLRQGVLVNTTPPRQLTFFEESGVGHVVNTSNLHISTIDLNTGITLKEFSYDQQNKLVSITDQFNNITTINRDTDGVPTSIVSPDGLITQLTIDTNGQLRGVIYPDNSGYTFEYTQEGLMTAEVDPNGNRFEHVFDVAGRVTDILDPEGGAWNFNRNVLDNGEVVVQKTTGEGNATTYLDKSFQALKPVLLPGLVAEYQQSAPLPTD